MASRGKKKRDNVFKVLLVCTGNTCRSPMADGILTHILPSIVAQKVEIGSAGVSAVDGEPASPGAVQVSGDNGIDISKHKSRRLTKALIEEADLVLVMQRVHMERVVQLCPSKREHVMLVTELGDANGSSVLGIPDPHGGNREVYERCFAQISQSLESGKDFLVELINTKGDSQ